MWYMDTWYYQKNIDWSWFWQVAFFYLFQELWSCVYHVVLSFAGTDILHKERNTTVCNWKWNSYTKPKLLLIIYSLHNQTSESM